MNAFGYMEKGRGSMLIYLPETATESEVVSGVGEMVKHQDSSLLVVNQPLDELTYKSPMTYFPTLETKMRENSSRIFLLSWAKKTVH